MAKSKLFSVVLDASIVAKLLIKEKDSEKAASLFDHLSDKSKIVYEPYFLKVEIYSLVRKKLAFKEITVPQAQRVLKLFGRLTFDYFQEDSQLLDRSFKLAQKLKQTVVYDCLYLALAQKERADFITADLKFLKQAKKIYSNSFSLSDCLFQLKRL